MFVLVRALTYGTLFIGLVLIYVPARLLAWSGILGPETIGIQRGALVAGGTNHTR